MEHWTSRIGSPSWVRSANGEQRCQPRQEGNWWRPEDDRQIWVGDDRVTDVVVATGLPGAAKGMAAVFDLQHAAADDCLFPVGLSRDRLFIDAKLEDA